MKNIIFVDIDGVLNNNDCKFLLQSIEVLKQLIECYSARVVMITSWQMNGTAKRREKIKSQLREFGIYDIDFIDPNFQGSFLDIILPSRLLGIVDYLKNNEVGSYVILDDEYYNDYKLICLNHYRTMPFKGLTYKDVAKIFLKPVNLGNFKYINYEYRELGKYELVTNELIKVLKKKYEKGIR